MWPLEEKSRTLPLTSSFPPPGWASISSEIFVYSFLQTSVAVGITQGESACHPCPYQRRVISMVGIDFWILLISSLQCNPFFIWLSRVTSHSSPTCFFLPDLRVAPQRQVELEPFLSFIRQLVQWDLPSLESGTLWVWILVSSLACFVNFLATLYNPCALH